MKKRKKLERIRMVIQILFFIAMPSVYASSFTAVKLAVTAIGGGQPLEMSEFALNLLVTAALTVLFGRIFCGFACAFGALGDWVYTFFQWLQKKCRVKHKVQLKLSDSWNSRLQYLKYLVLLLILALCFFGKGGLVSANSPWTVFSMLRSGNFAVSPFIPGLVLLLLILVGMAAKERFFCQYLCPMGAIYALLPVLPIGQFHRKREKCAKGCSACKKNCPVSLALDPENLKMGECIRCGRCAAICPKKNISLLPGKEQA